MSWYAIRAATRREQVAAAALTEMGVFTYLPCETVHRRLGGKKEAIHRPLFPGYLFVHTEPESFSAILGSDGVHDFVRVVSCAGERVAMAFPAPVIAEVFWRQLWGEFDYTREAPAYKPERGDRVKITGGKWGAMDYIGTVLSVTANERRAIVSLDAGSQINTEAANLIAAA